jgi:hypothetical protein
MGTRFERTLLLTVCALSLSCLSLRGAQELKPAPFVPGETLNYEVTWSVFSAGQVTATLRRVHNSAQDAYEVETTAHSKGFASVLFKVQNDFHSLFDPESVCSFRISKKINEGRRHKESQIVFDAKRRLAILDEHDLSGRAAPPKHAENEIPPCVQDVVSAFYFLRKRPLEVKQQLAIPVNDGAKTHLVVADVQARERIATPFGSRFAFRVEPKVFGELYKRRGRLLVWISDDAQRLPLRIKAVVSVGTITGTLKSVTTGAALSASAKP